MLSSTADCLYQNFDQCLRWLLTARTAQNEDPNWPENTENELIQLENLSSFDCIRGL